MPPEAQTTEPAVASWVADGTGTSRLFVGKVSVATVDLNIIAGTWWWEIHATGANGYATSERLAKRAARAAAKA